MLRLAPTGQDIRHGDCDAALRGSGLRGSTRYIYIYIYIYIYLLYIYVYIYYA